MKNLPTTIIYIVLCLSFTSLNAQWISSGDTLFTNQNVGIGTNTPSSKLNIIGGTDVNAVSGGYIITGNLNSHNLGIDNNEIQARNNGVASNISMNYEGGNITLGGPTPNKRFYLKTNGNVGIGTFSPASKLNIVDGTDVNAVSGGYIITGNLNSHNLGIDNNEIQARNNRVASSISINYDGGNITLGGPTANKRFYLKSNGNVGIGTFSPASKLNIVDGTDVNAVSGGYIITGNLNSHNLGIDNNEIQARNNGVASSISMNYDGGNITLGGPTANKRFYLKSNGNVGIGTNSIPSGYKFAIDGKAIMEELKVQLSQNWADYVFQEDYDLKSLEEVEQTIEEKGHLHNIASAQEIEAAGGIELGDITVNQQEKIEELFLHLIELNKEMKTLKQELKELKSSK